MFLPLICWLPLFSKSSPFVFGITSEITSQYQKLYGGYSNSNTYSVGDKIKSTNSFYFAGPTSYREK